MNEIDNIINTAMRQNRNTLSEFESTLLLKSFGIPTAKGILTQNLQEVKVAAKSIGYPVVLKVCSPEVSHKTESGLVAVNLRNEFDLAAAFQRICDASPVKKPAYLVQEMVKGERELVIGMIRDPQLGPCVMFGLGGIFTEILGDVTFRPAPLDESDAKEMMMEIRGAKVLGAIRGMAAVDYDSLMHSIMAVGRIGIERDEIQAIDVNPLIIQGSRPVAVDALAVLRGK